MEFIGTSLNTLSILGVIALVKNFIEVLFHHQVSLNLS